MIKRFLLVFAIVFGLKGYAQLDVENASPYSYYGIGSLKFKGTVENRSMGGLSIYNDSIHVNLRNPASYASSNLRYYNNEGRPVKFAIGGTHTSTNLKTNSNENRINSTSFDYMALSLPMGRFGVGLGIMPYTTVNYKLQSLTDFNALSTRFSGKGGVNKVFLSVGYRVMDGLSIGVDANYNFGKLENSFIRYLYDDEQNIIQYQTREQNKSQLSGFGVNLGVTYQKMISTKLELQAGLTYKPKTNINSDNERIFETITISSGSGAETPINSITADLDATGLANTKLSLPSKLSFGAGIGEPRKWFAGAELTFQNYSVFKNELYEASNSAGNLSYEDAIGLSVGGFYIPEYNSFSSYLKRMVYRTGFRFENTGLNINDTSINEFGMSFGVGIPMGNFFSNANVGFEFGRRGTLDRNLIQENFINFQISLSLNDRWFEKRKYN
ncbi:outer membrane protein transport protein [Mangrovimonas futianensis]|uniref:outer membrane protein transport protein n=1 Tax=Mangrovimonas futianensis TaxID=2895523 RepID=UPI001E5B0EE4|nr:outer membrane protein transport protein [Mangrovimonas futianensis]MCF1420306.1 outer membrane protein transport protein [Mangrovimonas futianensis]